MRFFKDHIEKVISKHTNLKKEDIKLEMPPSLNFGNYAFPCFILAKSLKKPPHLISQELSEKINPDRFIKKIKAVGPYLNFYLDQEKSNEIILESIKRLGFKKQKNKKHKIMAEFFHANTHKGVHIGHTRNICLGESLSRILESNNSVIRVNYQGDIGPHVAKCLYGVIKFKIKPPKTQKGVWLGELYARANQASKTNPSAEQEIKEINKKLYEGDKKILAVWKKTRKYCLDDFKEMYKDFGVNFNRFYFESQVEKQGIKITKKLLEKGIAVRSEGAIIINLKEYNLGVAVLLTKEGHALYHAKDLALAELKAKEYKNLTTSIHIVGKEQELYFNQLFKIFELINSPLKNKSLHLIYGLVMLPEGKMSSREGTLVLYTDLIKKMLNKAEQEVKKRHKDWPKRKIHQTARLIAFSALKYSMLSRENNRELIFNWDTALSFEGETGPYIQYAHARICSILKKHKKSNAKPDMSLLKEEKEQALISLLAEFTPTIDCSSKNLSPHILANYAYSVAKSFNEFYASCRVIQEDKSLEQSRIQLIQATKTILKESLQLLGINALDEM